MPRLTTSGAGRVRTTVRSEEMNLKSLPLMDKTVNSGIMALVWP
jgi:hypothetical protein